MIRITITGPRQDRRVQTFVQDEVTIGRSPESDICLSDRRVSKAHGVVTLTGGKLVFCDLGSTNGTIVVRDDTSSLVQNAEWELARGDVLRLGTYTLSVSPDDEPVLRDAAGTTVLMSRPVKRSGADVPARLGGDPHLATLFLDLMRQTGVRRDPGQLGTVLTSFLFAAFPEATHACIVIRSDETGRLEPFVVRARDGATRETQLSRTIVETVLRDVTALLFSKSEAELPGADSVVAARIQTAVTAPLIGHDSAFGVVQVDKRAADGAPFTKDDLELLTYCATYIGVVLENRLLVEEQRLGFRSTLHALLHSLALKDEAGAEHSVRVQKVATHVATTMDMDADTLERVSVAALVHDLGKQGIRDELLFKPDRLTPKEYDEVSQHAALTEDILAKIRFPHHLRDVPTIAAYHHEKIDGSGPYGIPGDRLPMPARIISVADAFDAILSRRVYKEACTVEETLAILEEGRGTTWDGGVIDALKVSLPAIMLDVYTDPAADVDVDETSPPRVAA